MSDDTYADTFDEEIDNPPVGASNLPTDEDNIPADTMYVICAGVEDNKLRSSAFWNVMIVLKRRGFTVDGIIALLEKYPDGIAKKYYGRLRDEVGHVYGKIKNEQAAQSLPSEISFVSQADFLKGFVPPDYIVDGVLQRRFLYSLTGVTSGGKTALALLLARAVGSTDPLAMFGCCGVENGKVVYFVGENPDDVRARVIGANSKRDDDPDTDCINYVVGVFNIEEMRDRLIAEAQRLGGLDLVIIDTSAAYFLKDDENSNPQMGAHARVLRSLTTLPGGPCVLALCHPIKHANDPSQLMPRGGGAFIAEVDGNLTVWKHDDELVEFHHSAKFRGPGFEPMTFRMEKITTTALVDSKGRLIPTVQAVYISEEEEAEQSAKVRKDEDQLLLVLHDNPERSVADLARACGFILGTGEPHKSKVKRTIDRLVAAKLAKAGRGGWVLTEEGHKAAKKILDDEEEILEDRGGATGSNKEQPFYALRGEKSRPTVPCAHCGQTGDVYKFVDGRVPKDKRRYMDLHEYCAEPYYTGKPRPTGNGSQWPADLLDIDDDDRPL
jgi:hypothetical protein